MHDPAGLAGQPKTSAIPRNTSLSVTLRSLRRPKGLGISSSEDAGMLLPDRSGLSMTGSRSLAAAGAEIKISNRKWTIEDGNPKFEIGNSKIETRKSKLGLEDPAPGTQHPVPSA